MWTPNARVIANLDIFQLCDELLKFFAMTKHVGTEFRCISTQFDLVKVFTSMTNET